MVMVPIPLVLVIPPTPLNCVFPPLSRGFYCVYILKSGLMELVHPKSQIVYRVESVKSVHTLLVVGSSKRRGGAGAL